MRIGRSRVASVSVRSLATSLARAKDTVARAICRQRDAGPVIAAQRRTTAGLVETGIYLVGLLDCIALLASARVTLQAHARSGTRDRSELSPAIEF